MKLLGSVSGVLLLAVSIVLAQQDAAVTISFEISNLKQQDAKILQGKLKGLTAVDACSISGSKATLTLKFDSTLTLTEIKNVVEAITTENGEKLSIKPDTITLEGKVAITFKTDKNPDKIKKALQGVSNIQNVSQTSEGYECVIRTPGNTKLVDVSAAACKAAELEIKSRTESTSIVKEIKWYGGPKPADRSSPSNSSPQPQAQPSRAPIQQPQPAPAPAPRRGHS